jgi:hypothetical protein
MINGAQIALLIATPLVVGVTAFLHRQGALSLAGAIVATGAVLGVATMLFLTQ